MNTMMKASRNLLLTGALLLSTVATAQQQAPVQQPAPSQTAAQQQQQKESVQPSVELARLTTELMADVQQQLSSSIRAEVSNAVAGLTDSLKQALNR
ncbi:hypothetical protein [Rheinheimera nanhaiensis]|uniref:Secreted protein n=1 Tax=Rheinheimera nanhaiensis E407-8 TaxID=562729 RepID=I1E016_9GAMM|nr:hypothetical protein [Rheinheimera nanhaiensis]GAB59644.1 hypothetical protein RNAN_2650 [Rheinheimera nanhaiensis E407-8]